MISHGSIWTAIDALALSHGLTPSGLARKAGLDPTTFNKSKRVGPDGVKPRWPSTESLVKALDAVGADLTAFAGLVQAAPDSGQPAPLLRLGLREEERAFDPTGRPTGDAWEEMRVPALGLGDVFGLEVSGDGLEPVYRDGDRLIVAPGLPVRRGDRVALQTRDGALLVREIARLSEARVELRFVTGAGAETLARDAVRWIARIAWASQ